MFYHFIMNDTGDEARENNNIVSHWGGGGG